MRTLQQNRLFCGVCLGTFVQASLQIACFGQAPAAPAAKPPAAQEGKGASDISAAAATAEPLNSKVETDPCASFRQLYSELPDDPAAARLSRDVVSARSSAGPSGKDQAIRDYYSKSFFPKFTHCDKQGEFQVFRKKLIGEIASCKSAAVHDLIVQVSLENCKKLLEGKFARSTKINALLIIGGLHDKEAVVTGGATSPAVPHKPAFPVLMEVASDAKADIDFRIAANLGLIEHAKSFADQKANKDIESLLSMAMNILKESRNPNAAEADGYYWMKGQAAEIIGSLGPHGAKAEAVDAVLAFMENTKAPVSFRVDAARAIGKLPLAASKDVSAVKLAKGLARLLVQSYDAEKNRVLAASAQGLSPAPLKFCSVSVGMALKGAPVATGQPAAAAKLGVQSLPEAELKQANLAQLLEIHSEWEKVFEDKKVDSAKMEQQLEVLKIKTEKWLRS